MAIGSPQWMYASGEDFTLDQSLKFTNHLGRKNNLAWTPGTPTNQKIWTLSFWIKSGVDGTGNNYMLSAGTSGTQNDTVQFRAGGEIDFGSYSSGYTHQLRTTAVHRDPSAWYHFLIAFDTTQGTEANRIKIYVNGVHQTSLLIANYPSQDATAGHVNAAELHNIGKSVWHDGGYLSGYLAEYHFIDGTALTPSSFGETGDYGEWKPIEVSGLTYGNNGFYLPFKQDYTVEGFSATTYRGNATTNYIGGVGFQPDLVWMKNREISASHGLYDSIRGTGTTKSLKSDSTAAEGDASTNMNLTSFDSDGFTLGATSGTNQINYEADGHIAWCWDMGGPNTTGIQHTITANGNAKHSTSENKIGGSSIAFDGSGDYLSIPQTPDFDFGTSDYTLELWVMHSGSGTILHIEGTDQYGLYLAYEAGGGGKYRFSAGIASDWGPVLNYVVAADGSNWHHIAVVCNSGTTTLYHDGVARASTTTVTNVAGNQGASIIGGRYGGVYEYDGYIDELRISNKARYTGNFTPSTSAFTSDKNTVLLVHSDTTNNSTTFVDDSGTTKNENGSIDSYVKANPTYGQSIVSYKGVSTAGTTIGHGLSSAPEMIIVKRRNAGSNHSWPVYHKDVLDGSSQRILRLDTTSAKFNDDTFHYTTPSNTTFTVGSSWGTNLPVGDDFIAYCFHSVTGYSKFGTYEGTGSTHTVTLGFAPAFLMIKNADSAGRWTMWDNTRSPNNNASVGKKMLRADVDSAEDTKTDREPTWLDTGFSIGDSDTDTNANGDTYIYMAFADKREYAYWLDQSGNNNDWTSNNLTESDIMVDSPTNNFATLNPLWIPPTYAANATGTVSEGNLHLEAESGAGKWKNLPATMASAVGTNTGSYFEVLWTEKEGANSLFSVWAGNDFSNSAEGTGVYVKYEQTGNVVGYPGRGTLATGTAIAQGDIVGCAIDDTNVKFYLNNALQATVTHGVFASYSSAYGSSSDIFGGVMVYDNGHDSQATVNYGQDSSFAGNKTAQGNQDGNSIGDFYYTPPTGYLALCTSNLPAVDVVPSEHFQAIAYTGDGVAAASGGQDIAVGFQPDFVWIKNLPRTESHNLFDVLRGVTEYLSSNGTGGDYDHDETLISFDSNGFTVGNENSVNRGPPNAEGYISWSWKAGGSGSSNTDGSVTTTVSANTDAGFSIVTYTGTGSSATFGHGLSKAPEISFYKVRSNDYQWMVYTGNTLSSTGLVLNGTDAGYSPGGTYGTHGASTFNLLTNADVNGSSKTYVSYHFHSVDGFSKVGSYEGNDSTDGTFVYTGFSPKFILFKNIDRAGQDWGIYDNVRHTTNPLGDRLLANSTAAEDANTDNIDFVSNGFKWRDNSYINNYTETYIYIAFAETPFKYANAR